jgi:multiple sugar transport system permease protein
MSTSVQKTLRVTAGRSSRHHMHYAAGRLMPEWVAWCIRIFMALVIAVPVLYLIVLSISPEVSVEAGSIVPPRIDLSNYAKMWNSVDLGRGLLNSVFICGLAAVLAVLVATMAAYPLARYVFRGRKSLLYSALGLQLIPGPMILLPMFVVFALLQVLLDVTVVGSYWGVIVSYLTFSLPLALWLMLGYIRTIPIELEEAASVDGASPLTILFRIVMPLAVPGMVVAFVFSLLLGWNDVLFATVLTEGSTRTVAVDLQLFTLTLGGEALPAYGQLMAAGVVVAIPVVAAYLLLQRYVVGGLAAGALK